MATISEALAMAVEHHQAGRFEAAEQIYRQILAVEPAQADAWHLLGVVAAQTGRPELAVEHIRRAIALSGNQAAFHANLANVLKRKGKLDDAVACYRRALELQPDYAEAHNNLGNALKGQGHLDEAAVCFRRALELQPDYAKAHNNLALVFQEQGHLDEAVACCRRALKLQPDMAEAHNNLGVALLGQRKLDEAVACHRRALELVPDYPEALANLGNALQDQGKLDEAVACYRRALELQPHFAGAHNNLGFALQQQGRLDEAVACYCRAVQRKPNYPEALNNLGATLQRQRKLDDAVACYRRAVELKPDMAEAHYNLSNAFRTQGYLDEAIASSRRALVLKPDMAEAHNNLGLALQEQGKLDEALASCRRAVELKPDFVDAHSNLGNVLKDQGKVDQAIACYRRALELQPHFADVHSNLLVTLQYQAGVTSSELAAAHAEYDRLHARPLRTAWPPHANVRDPERMLRVGFVSPDFGRHPVGYFLIRCLENFDRGQCETVCYSDRVILDDLTARLRAAAALWRDVGGSSDEQLAAAILADRIDILFDLAGHTARNRLPVFARKPAPLQVTWAGYMGTTGLTAIDYILADRHEIPPGAEAHYCEQVLRMPDGYVCYDPPGYAPPVSPLPALAAGCVTFGCFNNPTKIGARVIEVWAEILRRLPQSRLVLKYKGLNDLSVAAGVAAEFAGHGIDPQRVACLGRSPHAELLAEYHRVDLALDPFPYNGGLTTCEALWMGVPVITCPGETFAGRHSLSHLANVGLTETVARDLDEYVALAVSWAGDLPRLAALRGGLRQRMAASPLCDGRRFAANLTTVLRDIWRQWIAQEQE